MVNQNILLGTTHRAFITCTICSSFRQCG